MLFLSFSETDTADDRSESYKIINAATNSCQENGSEIRENKARRCDKRLIIIAILFLINVINSLFISLLSPFFPIVVCCFIEKKILKNKNDFYLLVGNTKRSE